MADIPARVIRSYLSTQKTYEHRKATGARSVECAYATAQAQFSLAMAKLRLLRAAGASPVMLTMTGEEMGRALHLIRYYRFRSPQVIENSVRQEELPLGV